MIRPEYTRMQEEGCPECVNMPGRSHEGVTLRAYESLPVVSVVGEIEVLICDDCEHEEVKYE